MDSSLPAYFDGFPRISILILNWNGRSHLEICLPALAVQTRRDFEVIVIDNGSTKDDSTAFMRAKHSWAHLLELDENLGFAGGNLVGLEKARGEYIVLLNNDTRPEPDFIEHLVACADAHPEAGMVAAHLVTWDGETTDSAGDACRVTGRGVARHRGCPSSEAPASGPCFGACAGAALYRREMIEDAGFLDADFFLNFEDTDLAARARWRGWEAWFCREARVRHRVSASQGSGSSWNVYYGARNHLWVCARNWPLELLLRYALINLAEILYMGGRACRQGRVRDYVRGLWAGMAGWRIQWGKRRAIMMARRLSTREFSLLLEGPSLPRAWRMRRARNRRGYES